MISSNETGKVAKLIIEVPEFEPPESFPSIFATRFSLGTHSPISRTPKYTRPKEFFKSTRSIGGTPTNTSSLHKVPFVFVINSNNLREKGSFSESSAQMSESEQFNHENYNRIYKEHLIQAYQSLKFVKELRPVDLQQLRAKRVTIPRRKGYEYKKTVIFDLDETLVHCCENSNIDPTVILSIAFPTGEVIEAPILIRPYAIECLKQVSKNFEVIVFTASHQCYADAVLDYLDSKREIIHHRFYRQHCVFMDGVYIKDLRIFANRKIKDMIIVDNYVHSFAYHLDNGIPIISWSDNQQDIELHGLMHYLKKMIGVEDVRIMNKNNFRLDTFVEDFNRENRLSGVDSGI